MANKKTSQKGSADNKGRSASKSNKTTNESLRHFSQIGDRNVNRLPIKVHGTGPDMPKRSAAKKSK